MRRPPLTLALLSICVLAANTSAQKQLYATILDSEGKPASSVAPEDLREAENGVAPDTSPGRFVESLGEALQRFERDKSDFFGVIVTVGTTQGDNKVLDRDISQIFERARKKPTTVHVVMMSTGAQTASGGVVQQDVGMSIAKQTSGRYESINASSRLATLLPEIGGLVKGGEGKSRQFRVTAERPGGASDAPSKLSMSGRNGKD